MRAVRVRLSSLFVSFRDPTTHKFQRTLPLPPITTVKGFLGAAMGLPPEEADKLPVRLAVALHRSKSRAIADTPGKVTDFWKYEKFKAGVRDTKDTVKRDILYRHEFIVYIVPAEVEPSVETIRDAISDPKWALSLGRDDELVRVADLQVVELRECEVNEFSDTLLPFDFKEQNGKPSAATVSGFVNGAIRTLEPPVVVSLPTGFTYDNRGVREASGLQPFTFAGTVPISFPKPVQGVVDDELGRCFVLY